MTSAPVITGPVEDTRQAHDATLDALRNAVRKTAELLRRVDNAAAPVPGLTWTAAETAAHMVGDLRDYAQALTRHTNGYMTHANRPQESPSRIERRRQRPPPDRGAGTRHGPARRHGRGGDDGLSGRGRLSGPGRRHPTPNGLVISPPTMTCLLLGEQVIHGLDISRAAKTGGTSGHATRS